MLVLVPGGRWVVWLRGVCVGIQSAGVTSYVLYELLDHTWLLHRSKKVASRALSKSLLAVMK